MANEVDDGTFDSEAHAARILRCYAIGFWFILSLFGSLFASFGFIMPRYAGIHDPMTGFSIAAAIGIPVFAVGCFATRSESVRVWSFYGLIVIAICTFIALRLT